MFKIINLPGLKQMGDNKDVTDWFEAGHTKSELYTAFKRSLDLKNKNELQQDSEGVYKTWFGKEDENGEKPEHKKYLTNFNVLERNTEKFGMYKPMEKYKVDLKITSNQYGISVAIESVLKDLGNILTQQQTINNSK